MISTSGSWSSACAIPTRWRYPPRQLADRLLDDQVEGAHVDDGVDTRPEHRRRELARLAEEAEHVDRGHVRVHRPVLGEVAETARGGDAVAPDIVARNGGLAPARRKVPGQHPHHRRFPGAVRPEKRDDLSLGNGERDVLDRDERSVVLGELPRLDHRRRCTRGFSPAVVTHHLHTGRIAPEPCRVACGKLTRPWPPRRRRAARASTQSSRWRRLPGARRRRQRIRIANHAPRLQDPPRAGPGVRAAQPEQK